MKTYKFTKKITEEQIDDIMDAALKGISYWADKVEVDLPPENWPEGMEYSSQALTHGRILTIHDAEEDKNHILIMANFLKGLSLMDDFDYYNYDMYDADKIIQYAIFGELIYG